MSRTLKASMSDVLHLVQVSKAESSTLILKRLLTSTVSVDVKDVEDSYRS